MFQTVRNRLQRDKFLFEELVKRDFKKKYKRTVLGILWSVLLPLMQLLVMTLVFTRFFGKSMEHYTIFLFAGNLVYNYFKESTNGGMQALMNNAGIITKINAPKYLFLLSKNISVLINFFFTLLVFFLFVAGERIAFHPRFFLLVYPVACLTVFNIGVGMILSALYVFFKDTQYLYDIFTLLLMYLSAIFYPINSFSSMTQKLFLLNPVFAYIHYFRLIVLNGVIPSYKIHLLCAFYAVIVLAVGSYIYKKHNYRFIYYM